MQGPDTTFWFINLYLNTETFYFLINERQDLSIFMPFAFFGRTRLSAILISFSLKWPGTFLLPEVFSDRCPLWTPCAILVRFPLLAPCLFFHVLFRDDFQSLECNKTFDADTLLALHFNPSNCILPDCRLRCKYLQQLHLFFSLSCGTTEINASAHSRRQSNVNCSVHPPHSYSFGGTVEKGQGLLFPLLQCLPLLWYSESCIVKYSLSSNLFWWQADYHD